MSAPSFQFFQKRVIGNIEGCQVRFPIGEQLEDDLEDIMYELYFTYGF